MRFMELTEQPLGGDKPKGALHIDVDEIAAVQECENIGTFVVLKSGTQFFVRENATEILCKVRG